MFGRRGKGSKRPPKAPSGERSWSFDWPTTIAGCGLIGVLLAVHVWDPPLVESTRLQIFDQYMRLKPRQPSNPSPVVIVDIDERSLEELGQWPWPRTLFAELLERLGELGAAVTAFDVIFAEPDRFSPSEYLATLDGVDPVTAATLRALPNNDDVLADAIRRHAVVLGQPASIAHMFQEASAEPPGMSVAEINGNPRPYLLSFPDLVRSIPVLEEAAAGVGLVTFNAEVDGLVRRVPAAANVSGRIIPTLAIEALRIATGQPTVAIRSGSNGIEGVILEGTSIPTDGEGYIWVHYAPLGSTTYVSALDVLFGGVDPEQIVGRVVFVGTSAAGLADLKATPVAARMPGVEVHAQLLETIQSQDHLRRPAYAAGAERTFFVGIGLALAIVGPLLPASLMPPVLLGGMLLAMGVSWYAFASHNLLIDGAYPAFGVVALVLWLALAKYIREQAMRRSIRSAFGHYLSPIMVDQLVATPDQLRLAGETRELTVLFTDVRGFTNLSESFAEAPEELTRFMNRYFSLMSEEILLRSGTIDKYIGDAIMAFWNAPLEVSAHERAACLAALAMIDQTHRLNAETQEQAAAAGHEVPSIAIGVGINSGPCYVGNMGSEQRFNYSALGDTVNVASRLEGQTKLYGVDIVIGESTQAAAEDLAALRLDLIQLKGKDLPVWIFGLLGDERVAQSEEFRTLMRVHDAMLEAYRSQNWDVAEQRLAEVRSRAGGFDLERLCTLYAERIGAMKVNPPGRDWDGVYVALTK